MLITKSKVGLAEKETVPVRQQEGGGVARGGGPVPLSLEKDRTAFVQGFSFQVGNLGVR